MFENRNVFDFKAVHSIEGGPHLSLVWQHAWDVSDLGYGIILDNSYSIWRKVTYPDEYGAFDIHEFNTLDDGNTSLALAYRQHTALLDDFGRPGETTGIFSAGFTEIDIIKGEIMSHWDSFDQVSLLETVEYSPESLAYGPPGGWDYVHVNSVDKNRDGNYILSYRFTNTVYMVSGADGRIMWRLGGKMSDFEQDFTFSKQHDAKFIESEGTRHVISILNNASDEYSNDESVSSVLIVELETGTTPMTAKLLRRYNRPDGKLTRLRGNAQVLPNKNVLAGWSSQGYISEHAEDGEVLYVANFASTRFSTYRSYKFEFTGRPTAPPDVVSRVWGTDPTHLTTTFYVSWNGATDIAYWNFYAQASVLGHAIFVGSTPKRNFETLYMAKGYLDWITAEAVDGEGNVLGVSKVHRTEVPAHLNDAGFAGNVQELRPDDPSVLLNSGGAQKEGNGDKGPSASDLQVAGVQSSELSRIVHETYTIVRNMSRLFGLVLIVALAGAISAGAYLWFRRRRTRSYQYVPREEDLPEEELRLRSVE